MNKNITEENDQSAKQHIIYKTMASCLTYYPMVNLLIIYKTKLRLLFKKEKVYAICMKKLGLLLQQRIYIHARPVTVSNQQILHAHKCVCYYSRDHKGDCKVDSTTTALRTKVLAPRGGCWLNVHYQGKIQSQYWPKRNRNFMNILTGYPWQFPEQNVGE